MDETLNDTHDGRSLARARVRERTYSDVFSSHTSHASHTSVGILIDCESSSLFAK